MLGCMRGRCAGVMVLVVSSLFPAFLSPSCLSEGGTSGSREASSILPEKSSRGSGIASASPGEAAEEDKLLHGVRARGDAVGGAGDTAFCRAITWH